MLGEEFYKREHTKPLFRKHHIMSLQNLYVYHTFMETFKILKFRSPISVHSMFNISKRKETTLITPFPSSSFVYRASSLWNAIAQKLNITDYGLNTGSVKNKLKISLLELQHKENPISWTSADHDISKIPTKKCSSNIHRSS